MLLDVTSIQHGCVYDGDGVRTTVFLRGCPYCCPWCCNPETLQLNDTFFIDEDKCLYKTGIKSPLCSGCERCGGQQSIVKCPFGVAEPTCNKYTIDDLFEDLIVDSSLYKQSNGGVTFSGGEPLLQSKHLEPLLQRLKDADIDIAYETTLYQPNSSVLSEVAKYVNQWIVDLKLQPVNFKKDYENVVSDNLQYLRGLNKKLSYRLVYVSGVDVLKTYSVLQRLDINNVEVIKCHALAKTKYKKLGLDFVDYTPPEKSYDDFVTKLLDMGLNVNKLTI